MSKTLLRHGTWFAICDGQRTLLLENQGDCAFPKLETREAFKQENPAAHFLGSAPPGRTFSSMGTRRSAMEEADFHTQAMAAFLRDFAEKLGHCVREHHIHALVLVAPAKVLGLIRPYLSKMTRQVLVAELDRDYVKMPLYEIERHIAALPYHNQMLGH